MKPLAFSRPMVLARRAGRKTQTRRLLKADRIATCLDGTVIPDWQLDILLAKCPYDRPGDRLWVREDFQVLHKVGRDDFQLSVCYLADDTQATVTLTDHEYALWAARKLPYRKTPARFMYRSLARDVPTLVSIRVERLQDITDADAIAEGIVPVPGTKAGQTLLDCQAVGQRDGMPNCLLHDTARSAFRHLWESIHGPASWTANPWVWVLELTPFKL